MKVVKQTLPEIDFQFTCQYCDSVLKADYWEIRLLYPWSKNMEEQRFLLHCEVCANPNKFKPEEIDIDERLKEGILSRSAIQIRNEELRKEIGYQVQRGVKSQSLGYSVPFVCTEHKP